MQLNKTFKAMHNIEQVPTHSSGKMEQYQYQRIYTILKAQRTILIETFNEFKDEKSEPYVAIQDAIVKLLSSTYGTLFAITQNSIKIVQNVITSSDDNKLIQYGERVLRPILLIKSIQALFQIIDDDFSEEEQKNEDYDDHVLCRICENYIPIEDIEKHTEQCVKRLQTKVNEEFITKEISSLYNDTNQNLDKREWPGEMEEATTVLIPLLHLNVILELLTRTNYQMSDSFLNKVHNHIKHMWTTIPKSSILHKVVMKASHLSHQKVYFSSVKKISTRAERMSINDFTLHKKISGGAYGKVFLATKKTTKEPFAIKAIPRRKVYQKNTAFIEKDVLSGLCSDKVVKMYYTIGGTKNLYIVLEYLPGGDLGSLLDEFGSFPEDVIRTYAAQVVQALDDLRKHGIIHRDLKPGNILITKEGHIKLIDFGLSYNGASERRTCSFGTPDYMAPEVVLSIPHSYGADYWSLGVMLYEFYNGLPPFHQDTVHDTFFSICSGKFAPLQDASDEMVDLINKLLTIDPEKRLGSKDIQEIKDHPFFSSVDWNNLDSLEVPFVPELKNISDTSYFHDQDDSNDMTDIISDVESAHKRACSFSEKYQDPSFHSVSVNELARKNVDDARQKRKVLQPAATRAAPRRSTLSKIPSFSPAPGLTAKSPILIQAAKLQQANRLYL